MNNHLNDTRYENTYVLQSRILLGWILRPVEENLPWACALVQYLPEAFKANGQESAVDHNSFAITGLNNDLSLFHV